MVNRSPARRDVAADLDLALQLAAFGSRLTLRRYTQGTLHVVDKADGTPVSDADMAAESEIRRRIEAARPEDGILGEEFGAEGDQRSRWLIDPIDGTANFIRGDPDWAVLIGLEIDRQVIAGVISAPAMGRRWWAARGLGAWVDGSRLRLPNPEKGISNATVTAQTRQALSLEPTHPLARALAGACAAETDLLWGDLVVAEGGADVSICLSAKPWHLAARKAVVTEAGARFTDIAGRDRIDTGTSLVATPALHQMLLASTRAGRQAARGSTAPGARHAALA